MSNHLKPIFGRWTTTLHCGCGNTSVLDLHAFRWLRAFDLDFNVPRCNCGQELLTKACVIPDTLWNFEGNCELKGNPEQ